MKNYKVSWTEVRSVVTEYTGIAKCESEDEIYDDIVNGYIEDITDERLLTEDIEVVMPLSGILWAAA